jgi:hypothetical protein
LAVRLQLVVDLLPQVRPHEEAVLPLVLRLSGPVEVFQDRASLKPLFRRRLAPDHAALEVEPLVKANSRSREHVVHDDEVVGLSPFALVLKLVDAVELAEGSVG